MEDSPLTIAHQQATLARSLVSSSSPLTPATLISAANAYALAATSFASAAKLTKDPEALRTLELLATEHERQASRLKISATAAEPADGGLETVQEGGGEVEEGTGKRGPKEKERVEKDEREREKERDRERDRETLQPPSMVGVSMMRKSTSLATNLASARGIPPRSATGVSSSRRRELKISTIPENSTPRQEERKQEAERKEEQFSKFYSGLNTILSRISSSASSAASLAFTGLPLGAGEVDEETERAALEGLLPKGWVEQRRGRNVLDKGWMDGGESFYVVPVSGGTMSYAGVVTRGEEEEQEKNLRRSRTYLSEASPSGPNTARDGRTLQLTGHAKTKEELVLENTGLRQTIDHMSRTMQTWQRKTRESENMLKNSIMALSKRDLHSNNPNSPSQPLDILSHVQRKSWMHVSYSGEEDDEEVSEGRRVGEMEWEKEKEREREEYVARLEEDLEKMKKEREEMQRENEKLKTMAARFKEKWVKLEERARNKRNNAGGPVKLGRVEEGE